MDRLKAFMDSDMVAGIFGLMFVVIIAMAVIVAIAIIPYWKIYQRTGQSGAMSLLQLIPLVNIIMLYVLAFGSWPLEDEYRKAQRELWDSRKGAGV